MKLTLKNKPIIALLAASISFPAFAASSNNLNCYDTYSCLSTLPKDFYVGLFETTLLLVGTAAVLDHLNLKEDTPYIAADVGSVSYRHAYGTNGSSPFPDAQAVHIAGGCRYYNPDDPNGVSLSFEAGLTMLESSTIDYGAAGQDVRVGSSVEIAAIFAYPVARRFDLTGRIGYESTKTSTHTSVAGMQNVDGSGTHAMYGVGLQYHINDHYLIRVQYENLDTIDRTQNPAKASVVSAGLAYEF